MMYEFRCNDPHDCKKREQFEGPLQASKAGWTLVEMRVGGAVRYVVRCPAHEPRWLKEAAADGARTGKR